MSVITFISHEKEETGKSLSIAAIATNMAIENNNKILIISTTNKKDKIEACFFEEGKAKKMRFGLFADTRSTLETESGIEGIAKVARSNKLTPDIITNYTKVVFKDRLEILPGTDRSQRNEQNLANGIEERELEQEYVNLISASAMYYDKVFVDLDFNIDEDVRKNIIQMSDLVVVNTSQNLKSIDKLAELKQTDALLQSPKTLLLVGRYDKFSKYNSKNITRLLNEKNQVLTIPYNTLFLEAANEAGVPDLFLSLRKLSDSEDRNMFFMQEIKRAGENINYRLQELQARY